MPGNSFAGPGGLAGATRRAQTRGPSSAAQDMDVAHAPVGRLRAANRRPLPASAQAARRRTGLPSSAFIHASEKNLKSWNSASLQRRRSSTSRRDRLKRQPAPSEARTLSNIPPTVGPQLLFRRSAFIHSSEKNAVHLETLRGQTFTYGGARVSCLESLLLFRERVLARRDVTDANLPPTVEPCSLV